MSNTKELAIILSRCIPLLNTHDNEFLNIPCSKECKIKNGAEASVKLLTPIPDHSIEGCFNLEENIVWIDGYGCTQICEEFRKLIADDIQVQENEVTGFIKSLIKEIGNITGEKNIQNVIFIIHAGGSRKQESYKRLWTRIHDIFTTLNITVKCRFSSSDHDYFQSSWEQYKTSAIIPHTLAGLQKDNDIQDVKFIRNWLNSLSDKIWFPTLFENGISLEKCMFEASNQSGNALLSELNELCEELGYPFSAAQYKEWLNYFFTNPGDLEASGSPVGIYKAIVIEREEGKIIEEEPLPTDHVLYGAIKNLVPSEIASQCIIVYLGIEALRKGHFDKPYKIQENIKKIETIKPRIFVTLFDIVGLSNEADAVDEDIRLVNKEIISRLYGRFRFYDHCIWFRLIPVFANKERRKDVFDDIQYAFEKDLFSITQTLEARDLALRAFNQSYILKQDLSRDTHGQRVTPWIFHSEYRAKKKIDRLKGETCFKDFKWNFLLIDDHAYLPVDGIDKSKAQLIHETFTKYLPEELLKNFHFDNSESVTNVQDAIARLKESGKQSTSEKWYDIILLDYLLLKNESSQFADEIIRSIHSYDKFDAGPLRKVCFFPITVYAQAIYSKLREAGIQIYSDKFIVANGADPICTPNLFVHNLLEILKIQVDELHKMAGADQGSLKNEHPVLYHLKQIPQGDVKQNAIDLFPKVVELHVFYKRIKDWYYKSKFSETIYNNVFKGMEAHELEQFRDVVYLLAFGSINDKNKLWGEWAILKDILTTRLKLSADEQKHFETIKLNIENHISTI